MAMRDKDRQNLVFVFFDFPSLSRAENAATVSSRFLHTSSTGSAWVGTKRDFSPARCHFAAAADEATSHGGYLVAQGGS